MIEGPSKRVTKKIKFSISLSQEQKLAKANILIHPVNFIVGKVGSGKTILACNIALDLLFRSEVDKIVISRPTVSSEDNGYLPGSLNDKLEPWMVPIRSNMHKIYNKPDKLRDLEENEIIELVSLSHFRGRTFDKAVCIIDEFQNLTKNQLLMAIGRLGKNSMIIFTGDRQQIDLKDKDKSAVYLVDRIEKSKYVNVSILQDNHRHEAIDDIMNILKGMSSHE